MDGGGMQFVAFEARDPVTDIQAARRNPFLSRDDMRAVLARSLELYQSRNGRSCPSGWSFIRPPPSRTATLTLGP